MGNVIQKNRRRRGTAVVEATFMMPWLAFLFVGVLDMGFYSYAAISTQNAARAAAIRTARGNSAPSLVEACAAAVAELEGLPNVTLATPCNALPVVVTVSKLCAAGSSGAGCVSSPICADCDPSVTNYQTNASVLATVTYQSMPMVPIPGLLTGQLTLTRKAEARILVQN